MTCIVAVTDGQNVVLGGDSAASGGNELRLEAAPKVFKVGHFAIGFTTSFRMGQILQYETTFPEPEPGLEKDELERFMVNRVIPAIRHSFADHGFVKKARRTISGEPSITEEGQDVGGVFLVGVGRRIFEIRRDFALGRPVKPYSAVGCAALIALGAFHALEPMPELSLRDRARRALEAAEAYSSFVRRPFHFIEL